MNEQLKNLFIQVRDLGNYLETTGVGLNLSIMKAEVALIQERLRTVLTDGAPEPSRRVVQVATTPDTVTALCEDGSIWCYDQSASWKPYPGIPL